MKATDVETAEGSDRLVIREIADEKLVEVELSGKLTREDYDRFVPELERLFKQHGRIRLLVIMRDFHGWKLAALWQDIKFDLHHFKNFERIAIVGETKWQEWMSTICVPFTTGEVRYFHHDKIAEARAWLQGQEHSAHAGV